MAAARGVEVEAKEEVFNQLPPAENLFPTYPQEELITKYSDLLRKILNYNAFFGFIIPLGDDGFAVYDYSIGHRGYILAVYSLQDNEIKCVSSTPFSRNIRYDSMSFHIPEAEKPGVLVCARGGEVHFYEKQANGKFVRENKHLQRETHSDIHDNHADCLYYLSNKEVLYYTNCGLYKIDVSKRSFSKERVINTSGAARNYAYLFNHEGPPDEVLQVHCVIPELDIAVFSASTTVFCLLQLSTMKTLYLLEQSHQLPSQYRPRATFSAIQKTGEFWFQVVDHRGFYIKCDSLLKDFLNSGRALSTSAAIKEGLEFSGVNDALNELTGIICGYREDFFPFAEEKTRVSQEQSACLKETLEYFTNRYGFYVKADFYAKLDNFVQCLVALTQEKPLPADSFPAPQYNFLLFSCPVSNGNYEALRQKFSKVSTAMAKYFIEFQLPVYKAGKETKNIIAAMILERLEIAKRQHIRRPF